MIYVIIYNDKYYLFISIFFLMLSRISRLPLRRCLHTGAQAAKGASSFGRTAKFIVGVSTFSATAYLTWRLRDSRHIALDSPSSNSPPNSEIPHSSTNSDPDTISGDAKNGDNVDEDNVDGEGVDGDGVDGEGSSEGAPASGGAFNPETGEINWDCPCLGGMAHGPCGPEFREAFSCFVYSEAEPKGINCVEKFQNMQNCFRAHPEIYADGGIILFFVSIICVLIGGVLQKLRMTTTKNNLHTRSHQVLTKSMTTQLLNSTHHQSPQY